jgi:hypothetical protein
LGYTYTLLKGKEKVNGEFALIFACYNLKRVLSILGVKEVIKRLKRLFSHFLIPCTIVIALNTVLKPCYGERSACIAAA